MDKEINLKGVAGREGGRGGDRAGEDKDLTLLWLESCRVLILMNVHV